MDLVFGQVCSGCYPDMIFVFMGVGQHLLDIINIIHINTIFIINMRVGAFNRGDGVGFKKSGFLGILYGLGAICFY